MALAPLHQQRHNAPVPFNSGSGFGDPINEGGQPPYAAFFTSVRNTIGAPSSSMAGRGGDTFGYAGCLRTGSPTPPRACHPRLATGSEPYAHTKEATMPSIARALSRLLPIFSTISTTATMAEAQNIARLHLARTGHAVRIAPASVGFSVVEVR